jgi:hypothetical protein
MKAEFSMAVKMKVMVFGAVQPGRQLTVSQKEPTVSILSLHGMKTQKTMILMVSYVRRTVNSFGQHNKSDYVLLG